MEKKITFLKGNLCMYIVSWTFYTFFFFGAKEKLQTALRFEFCYVLISRFYLRERIHDPDSGTRIALED